MIGIDNDIPWRIPEDFKHFRDTTMGNMLLVGATTFKGLPLKAHEGREFIILNSGEHLDVPNKDRYFQFSSLDLVLELLSNGRNDFDKIYIIGGASIYDIFIDYCDEAIITWVDKIIPHGNKKFPIVKLIANFEIDNEQEWQTSKTGERYKFVNYKRKI